jgi:adenylate cyclase
MDQEPRGMKKLPSTLLTAPYHINWPQSLLLALMFLLFICNAIGLVHFRSDFLEGVDLNLAVFSSLDHNLQLPQIMATEEFLLLVLSGILAILLLPLLSPIVASAFIILLAIPPLWMDLSEPYRVSAVPFQFSWLVLMILFGVNVLIKYYTETREKQKLLDIFSQFVPPEIVSALSHQDQQLALEGESRYLTVLFCDLRNFTAMAEQLDPREVVRLLNQYFTAMTATLYQHGATIDKYIGDSVMAFWGAPLPQEDHYQRAVLASLELHKQMESLADIFHARGLPRPTIGIGINSGLMNVGNMGSRYRLAYTVIGDAVNLAFRLQGATRHYHVNTIVGENTVRLYPEMRFRELDTVAVKGKTQSTRIYEPLCQHQQLSPELEAQLQQHQEALACWYAQDIDAARQRFTTLASQYPADAYYRTMAERCSMGAPAAIIL